MLNINELYVKIGDKVILDIKKLKTSSNRIGIYGKNGSGKTTLIKCLLGVIPYKGNIKTDKKYDELEVVLQKNNYSYFAKVKDLVSLIVDEKNINNVENLIKLMNYEYCLNKKVKDLSGGEHQKLNLILALSSKPSLFIADEISTGLDYDSRVEIIKYLKNYVLKNKASIMIISHYPMELNKLVDEVIILDNGSFVKILPIDKFIKEYNHEAY